MVAPAAGEFWRWGGGEVDGVVEANSKRWFTTSFLQPLP